MSTLLYAHEAWDWGTNFTCTLFIHDTRTGLGTKGAISNVTLPNSSRSSRYVEVVFNGGAASGTFAQK